MPAERNLKSLLATMSPVLMDEEFVFITFKTSSYGDHSELEPFAAVCEAEGLTLVVSKSVAEAQQLSYESVFRGITLRVHSSLEAVGLTAAFSAELASNNISANVLAGFYHDHIFVPSVDANKALKVLQAVAAASSD